MKPLFLSLVLFLGLSACKAQNLIADGAELTLVSEEFEFTEGPAMDSHGDVYFTDQPNNRILKWDASTNAITTYMQPAGRSNGLYVDHEGNLLACADEKNELWRIGPDKKVEVLIDDYEGKILNGPNDLWLDPQGGIYFTDPYYQRSWWSHTEPEQETKRVYYLPPGADRPKVVAEGFDQPNGIIGTPDGKTLYIADNGAKKTYVFRIAEDHSLNDRTLFADMGSDGMTVDNLGNVYLTGDGVTIFDKAGTKIKHIPIPENWTANVTFGGPNQDLLFITAMDSVYTLKMDVHGVR